MKEYFVFKICEYAGDTQENLNELAKSGWRLICSYAKDNEYLILERDAISELDEGSSK